MTYNEKKVLEYMLYSYLGYNLVDRKFENFDGVIFCIKELLKIETIEISEMNTKKEKKCLDYYNTIVFKFLCQEIVMDIYYEKDVDGFSIVSEIDINFLKVEENKWN